MLYPVNELLGYQYRMENSLDGDGKVMNWLYLNLMRALWIVVLFLPLMANCAVKTLTAGCLCDVSSGCDAYCCCDADCPSSLISNWNNFALCGNDGYAIPLCSSFYNQPLHTHDLYQGLRLIYTIVKRLFCISKVNFVEPAKSFTSTTTNEQISIKDTTVSAVSPAVLGLSTYTDYGKLPLRSGMGVCGQYTLRDMHNIQEGECRVLFSSTGTLSTNNFLSLAQFKTNNNLGGALQVYLMSSNSAAAQNASSSGSTCTGNLCLVVRQIKLFFIKSGGTVSVDYSSSYVVLGNIALNSPTYVLIKYSYQFISQAGNYPYSSTIGYAKGAPLVLLKSLTSGSSTSYYKIFNPVNLAFMDMDGTCRTSSTSDAGPSNLITLKFGVNSIYTCQGSSSLVLNNLKQAFDLVGSIGSAASSLDDYISIDFSPASSATNQNLQLVFYYLPIGTQANPQYQITKAALNPLTVASNGQFTLFVEYVGVSSSIVLNLPSPPVINAYLPDDFLYPFYVA